MTEKLPTVIGFTGVGGSGKSTAAGWITDNHTNVIQVSFASPIKNLTRRFLEDLMPRKWPISPAEYIRSRELREEPVPFAGGFTPRKLMQTLGTEWGRESLHPDIWVSIMAQKIERLMGHSFRKGPNIHIQVVIDDVRFANEALMVRAYGGKVVRVERPGNPHQTAAHVSETLDFEPDATLLNDGTEADLYASLAAMFPVPPKVLTRRR